MDAEIVFTGLCSILNPFDENAEMGDPAVILVQTPHHDHHDHHIAFLAFDPSKVAFTGDVTPTDVLRGEPFVYVNLDGWELLIDDNPPAKAKPKDDTYRDRVVHRDEYWPEMKGVFDRAYVPVKGARPTKEAVKAWMRLGIGEISASRISKVPWRFTQSNGEFIEKNFAEEIVYDSFPHSESAVVVRRKDLVSGNDVGRPWEFRLKEGAQAPLTLIVGNNLEEDMADAVYRKETKRVAKPYADHFEFLNCVAGKEPGPVPTAINPPADGGDGGGSGGVCGPGSGNGTPTSILSNADSKITEGDADEPLLGKPC